MSDKRKKSFWEKYDEEEPKITEEELLELAGKLEKSKSDKIVQMFEKLN